MSRTSSMLLIHRKWPHSTWMLNFHSWSLLLVSPPLRLKLTRWTWSLLQVTKDVAGIERTFPGSLFPARNACCFCPRSKRRTGARTEREYATWRTVKSSKILQDKHCFPKHCIVLVECFALLIIEVIFSSTWNQERKFCDVDSEVCLSFDWSPLIVFVDIANVMGNRRNDE